MANDRIAALIFGDSFSYLFYPTGVFVSHHVGKFHVHFLTPDTLDDMKIGTANASTADSHNHVRWVLDLRFWYVLQSDVLWSGELSVVLVENSGFHRIDGG